MPLYLLSMLIHNRTCPLVLPDTRIKPSSSYIGHVSENVCLFISSQPIRHLTLGKYKPFLMSTLSIYTLIRLPARPSVQHLQRLTGKVSDCSSTSAFLRLGRLIISGAAFPPSFLQALADSKRLHLSPQYVTSSSGSCISKRTPPPPIPSAAPPAGLVLVSAVPRNGWSAFDRALEGTCHYLTKAAGFHHCHACALANFRVCLLWQLEPFVTEEDRELQIKSFVPSNLTVKLIFPRLVKMGSTNTSDGNLTCL